MTDFRYLHYATPLATRRGAPHLRRRQLPPRSPQHLTSLSSADLISSRVWIRIQNSNPKRNLTWRRSKFARSSAPDAVVALPQIWNSHAIETKAFPSSRV